MIFKITAVIIAFLSTLSVATAYDIKPYKDNLFKYSWIIETDLSWSYRMISYSQKRDLEDRDAIAEKRVKDEYVSVLNKTDTFFQLWRKRIDYIQVWKNNKDTKFIVLYMHGMGGNRFQGVNDWTFWGNFNRIQNISVSNWGTYISPDFSDFWKTGISQMKALILRKKYESPSAKIIVSCASSGWSICWGLAKEKNIVDWLVILGSNNDYQFLKNATKKIPIYMAHGQKDRVISMKSQYDFFKYALQEKKFPIIMETFENGTHGTPIRMVDWKIALNWVLSH